MSANDARLKLRATQEFTDANIMEVEVGTTGPQGGDASHGGYTSLRIKNLAGTAMEVHVNGTRVRHGDCLDEVVLVFRGDAEMRTFRDALRFAVAALDLA